MRPPRRLAALLVLAPALLSGCLTARDVLVASDWTLVEVHGAAPVAEASVRFTGQGEFVVKTGCNTVGGTYHLEGNRIRLDTVHQSLVLCEGDLAVQEAAILAVVKLAPVYAIDTGTGRLRLTSEADQVLLFEP